MLRHRAGLVGQAILVLDGDYMGVPEDKISDIKVMMTIVNGKKAFSAAPRAR